MAELLRTRCSAGFLVITEQAIRIERKGLLGAGGRLDVLPRQAIVGVKLENKIAPLFGKGGGSTLIFSGQGTAFIRAEMVNAADAQRAMELLGFA